MYETLSDTHRPFLHMENYHTEKIKWQWSRILPMCYHFAREDPPYTWSVVTFERLLIAITSKQKRNYCIHRPYERHFPWNMVYESRFLNWRAWTFLLLVNNDAMLWALIFQFWYERIWYIILIDILGLVLRLYKSPPNLQSVRRGVWDIMKIWCQPFTVSIMSDLTHLLSQSKSKAMSGCMLLFLSASRLQQALNKYVLNLSWHLEPSQ
jgi:hypothetical protein